MAYHRYICIGVYVVHAWGSVQLINKISTKVDFFYMSSSICHYLFNSRLYVVRSPWCEKRPGTLITADSIVLHIRLIMVGHKVAHSSLELMMTIPVTWCHCKPVDRVKLDHLSHCFCWFFPLRFFILKVFFNCTITEVNTGGNNKVLIMNILFSGLIEHAI